MECLVGNACQRNRHTHTHCYVQNSYVVTAYRCFVHQQSTALSVCKDCCFVAICSITKGGISRLNGSITQTLPPFHLPCESDAESPPSGSEFPLCLRIY